MRLYTTHVAKMFVLRFCVTMYAILLTFVTLYTTICNKGGVCMDSNKLVRFLLTFFLGFLGSFIINHTSLKPSGFKSRTCSYFFWGIFTFGIYPIVASICNFSFNPEQESNIGYFKA